MKKNLGILGTTALALTLLLSSCSTSSEEATIDTGILERLNAATGFSWEVDSANDRNKWEFDNLTDEERTKPTLWNSEGYIQMLNAGANDILKCINQVFVYENEEFAAKARERAKADFDDWDGFVGVLTDPVTNYGIVLVDYGDSCRDKIASVFDFVLPESLIDSDY
jgi:hypothetical protein